MARARSASCTTAAERLDALRLDALRFQGPGTDLTVGLLPTSRFARRAPGMKTVDGIAHNPNLPTEEVFTTPDPLRVDGVVTRDEAARRRRHGGRGAPRPVRGRAARSRSTPTRRRGAARPRRQDEGASRLGEVALVDREGRIGRTDTVFFNTLLDENAASHLALGNAYAIARRRGGRDRINRARSTSTS